MKWRLTVTQEDIRTGKRKTANQCAIARAVNRRLGMKKILVDDMRVMVGSGRVFLYKEGYRHDAQEMAVLSPEACKFVEDFDKGKKVKPFTTVLNFVPRVA